LFASTFWKQSISQNTAGFGNGNLYDVYSSPNGKDCKYRHALPPGFILKKRETEEERREREAREKANQITIEDFLEKEVGKRLI
jgi:hypothetical protein